LRIQFSDGNEIDIKGNRWFVANVFQAIAVTVLRPYAEVFRLNNEPTDDKRFELEIYAAERACGNNERFNGKYVTIAPAKEPTDE
jgi:hypothetical protein